jgi:large conductance mechanosensitive channel
VSLFQEFKEFAMRGNVVDMAVGVVIGGAFGKIVTSLVNDIVMPLIGAVTGGIDLKEKVLVLGSAAAGASPATLNYGAFISTAIDFTIVAFSIFMAIKVANKLTRTPVASITKPK